MSSAAKFHGLIATMTIFVMFWAITYAVPAIKIAVNIPLLSGFATIVGSVGIYRLLAIGLEWIFRRVLLIRRWIFGPSFMHGTWIGYFVGHAGDKRYTIEHYDQELDGLSIIGRSLTVDKKLHAQWHSNSIGIDIRQGSLIFTSTLNILSRQRSEESVNILQFERVAAYSAPTSVTGFSQDLGDDRRIATHAIKISDKLLPWDDALVIAIKRFS
jgi:hypothetical protein